MQALNRSLREDEAQPCSLMGLMKQAPPRQPRPPQPPPAVAVKLQNLVLGCWRQTDVLAHKETCFLTEPDMIAKPFMQLFYLIESLFMQLHYVTDPPYTFDVLQTGSPQTTHLPNSLVT